jgi:CelD/BcsL family acetyltransferase involved in cellulose biosynthesis
MGDLFRSVPSLERPATGLGVPGTPAPPTTLPRLQIVPPSEWTEGFVSEWSALLEESGEPRVFLSPEWILAWWRAYGQALEPRMLVARDEAGRLTALAPMYVRPPRLGAFKVLRFMSDEGPGSEYLGVLCRKGLEASFLESLVFEGARDCALIDLQGLREDGLQARLAAEVLSRGSKVLVHRERHACYCVRLPSDYEAYLASLKPKFRSTIRHRTNKLLKNTATKLVRTTSADDLERHLACLFDLHQRRWRHGGLPGVFGDKAKRAFYRDFAPAFQRRGWLRFYHLEVDGTIRASQIGFAFGGVFHSLQEAFDPSYRPPGISGLGVVLRGMAIRECIAEGLSGYDFLGWEGEIKERWGTEMLFVQRLRAAAPGLAGALAFGTGPGRSIARAFFRRHSPGWVFRLRNSVRDRVRAVRAHAVEDEP